ncbi:MAG: PAS domain S-box protein [Deltaproteobacteria bacterium]|nr:PAS domain S-box protein [Deltaproteobacteria bacterium]
MASPDPTDLEARRLAVLRALGLLDPAPLPALQAVAEAAVVALGATWGAVVAVHGDRVVPKACAGAPLGSALRIGPIAAFAVATGALHVADSATDDVDARPEFVAAAPVHIGSGLAVAAVCVCHPIAGALDGPRAGVLRAMARLAELELAALHGRADAAPDRLGVLAVQMLGPGDCLLVVDAAGALTEFAAGPGTLWRDLAAFAGQPLGEIAQSPAGAAALPAVRRALHDDPTHALEVSLVLPGSVGAVEVRAWPQADGQKVVRLRDVSELRLGQVMLQRREAQMHQTEQIASIGGFDVAFPSGTGEFTRHTHRMLDLPQDFAGDIWHLLNLIAPEARERAMEQLARAVDDGMLFDIEAPIETPAGHRLLVRLMGLPEYGEGGGCERVTGAVQDITAARAAELESQARASTLQAIALAQSEMLLTGDAEVPLKALLEAALQATGSEAGFVGVHERTATGDLAMATRGWMFGGAATGEKPHTPVADLSEPMAHRCPSVLGHPLSSDAPIFVHDSDFDASDLPPGGVSVRHLLALPFCVGGTTAGMLVLVNRQAGYYPHVAEALEPIVQTCASIVASLRADAAREAATLLARDAEAMWRTLFEMQVDGIVTCDEAGRIESMNPAAERVFGFAPGGWHDLNVSALMRPEIDRIHDSFLRRHTHGLVTTALGISRELEGVRTDGSVFPLELSLSAYHHGNKHRFAGVVRDVSVRKALERQLRARQELLEASEEIARLGSWSVDLRTGRVEGSDEFFRVVGVLAGTEPTQELMQSVVHPDDLPRLLEAVERTLEDDTPINVGYRNVMPDGSVRECHVRARLVRDAEGQPHFLRGATQDVTELRTIERELRERESFLRRLTDTAEEAIWAATLDGVTTFANPKYLELIGKSAEEVIGRSVFEYMLPSAGETIRGILDRRAQGIRETTEMNLEFATGCHLDVLISGSPLVDEVGTIVGALALMTDITVRKRSERKLQEQAEKLEAMNHKLSQVMKLKDNFLAAMSHELRTPLNAILGLSEALQEEVYGPLTNRQRKSLQTVEESGRHLLALINDILDLSKIEADRLTLNQALVDVDELCNTSLRLVRESAMRKGLSVKTEIDPTVGVVHVDLLRCKQILVNLLSNAIKFTESGGEVGLGADADPAAGVVRLAVWDTGIGIAAEDQGKLFQPFVQLDSALSRQHTGTGLGLALVERLARLHGGTVQLQSKPGEGTRVTVTLPWTPPEPVPRARWRESGIYITGMIPTISRTADKTRVLLVDDNAANVETVRDYLESHHYRVAVAQSGEAALELLLALSPAERPHIILMDVQMPGIDGVETTVRLRKLRNYAATPIIAVTALAMPGDRERCLAAGMNEFLSKPVRLALLQETIGRLLTSLRMPKA